MPIVKYAPFADTEDFPTGLRLFQDSINRLLSEDGVKTRPWAPAVDILETENELILKADVPGVELKDIDIQLENGTLTVKGERKFEKEREEQGLPSDGAELRVVCPISSQCRTTVDAEHVKAAYEAGVLTITLPKKEIAKPKDNQSASQ